MRMRNNRVHYERDDKAWGAEAYSHRGRRDVAWAVLGWHTVPDEDTHWSGYEVRSGKIVCYMIGDDARHLLDPDDVSPLAREEYCGQCGQIGCTHDGVER